MIRLHDWSDRSVYLICPDNGPIIALILCDYAAKMDDWSTLQRFCWTSHNSTGLQDDAEQNVRQGSRVRLLPDQSDWPGCRWWEQQLLLD